MENLKKGLKMDLYTSVVAPYFFFSELEPEPAPYIEIYGAGTGAKVFCFKWKKGKTIYITDPNYWFLEVFLWNLVWNQ